MRTSNKQKQERKVSALRPTVRTLKIYSKYQERAYHQHANVPEIRLCGRWLDKPGFCKGRHVTFTVMNDVQVVALQQGPVDAEVASPVSPKARRERDLHPNLYIAKPLISPPLIRLFTGTYPHFKRKESVKSQ